MNFSTDHYNRLRFYYDCFYKNPNSLIIIKGAKNFWTFDNSAHKLSNQFDQKTFALGELRIPAICLDQDTLYHFIRVMDPFSRKTLRIYNPDGQLNTSIYHVDKNNEIFLPGEYLKYSPDDPMWYHYNGPVFLPEYITEKSIFGTGESIQNSFDISMNQVPDSKSNLLRYVKLYRQISSLLNYASLDSCQSMAMAYRKLKSTSIQVEKDLQSIPEQMALF